MSIEEKEKEKDKSIYNYNMIFNKIGNDNSEEDIKFNTDLISDLDLRNFDPKRYEYYTNLLKIYNEDPDTLFNLLNKYNSIKYTKEEEKKLIRQIYDYAVKYAKAKKADKDWEEARKIERKIEEAKLAKEKADTDALAKKTETGADAAAKELEKKTAMRSEAIHGGKEGEAAGGAAPGATAPGVAAAEAAAAATAPAATAPAAAEAAATAATAATAPAAPGATAPAAPGATAPGVARIQLRTFIQDNIIKPKTDIRGNRLAQTVIDVMIKERKERKERNEPTTDIIETPIEKLINKLSEKLNGEYVPNPNEDDEASARYSETFTNNYKDEDENEKKTPEEKLKDNDEKNLNELKDTYKDTINPPTVKEKKLDKATAKEKGTGLVESPSPSPGTPSPSPSPSRPPSRTPPSSPPPSPPPIKQQVEDQLLTGAIDLDLIGNQPEEELPEPGPTPPAPPAEVSVADELLQKALELNLIGNQPAPAPAPTEINEDELLKQALSLSKKILQNINGIENKEKTILDKAIDLLPDLLNKETPAPAPTPEPPVEESKLLNSAFGLLPGLLKKETAEAAAEAAAAEAEAAAEAAAAEAEAAAEAVKEDNKLLDETVKLSKTLLDPAPASGGGKKKLRGGAIDKYSDDILKMQYLDTKRYKNVKKEDLKDYRTQQKIRKYNIVPTETTNKIEQLSNEMDVYNDKIDKNNDDDKYIIQQIKNFENDPKNPIEELALTFDDRIVFIIATFFIRYITIIMVQWCIDINIIKTFYEGFIYYAIIYILIFWFIVLFVNIDNTYDVKYMNFNGVINSIRTIFYYFYMGTNGISRLLIHTSLIIILIIIPIILNIKGKVEFKDEDQSDAVVILAYEERKQLSKSLSLFTMFIWLFTSIIATKF